MLTFLMITSGVLTIAAVVPYVLEIVRGTTKPRVVSWFTWSVLTGIACAASFADGQVPGGILLLSGTIATALVVALGFKHGDRKFEKLDMYCLAGAVMGLLAWPLFDAPEAAVIATVVIDLVGAVPTLKHSWDKPHEETAITFILSAAGAAITLAIAGSWAITAVLYPIYLVAMNAIIAGLIVGSPNKKLKGEPAEQAES